MCVCVRTTLMCCTCIVCSRCFISLCSERSSWSTNLPPCPMECQRYHHPSPHTHTHSTPTLPHLICYMCCILHTWTHTHHIPHPSHPSLTLNNCTLFTLNPSPPHPSHTLTPHTPSHTHSFPSVCVLFWNFKSCLPSSSSVSDGTSTLS